MQRLTDLKLLKWITNNRDELKSSEDPNWNGNFVSHCIPAQFQSYAKILHPMYIDTIVNRYEISSGESALVYEGLKPSGKVQRIRWRDLSQRCGLQFHSEINSYSFENWPHNLIIWPEEGTLERFYCERLVELLAPFTKSSNCYFAYELIATQSYDTDLLYRGKLKEVIDTFDCDNVWGTPTYWWPEDKSWCVCTDWDLTFTLLGGCDELIETLLEDEVVECVRVEAGSRIDYKSDQINL